MDIKELEDRVEELGEAQQQAAMAHFHALAALVETMLGIAPDFGEKFRRAFIAQYDRDRPILFREYYEESNQLLKRLQMETIESPFSEKE